MVLGVEPGAGLPRTGVGAAAMNPDEPTIPDEGLLDLLVSYDEALAAGRAIARRIREEVPECDAGIGVAAGEAVAGNLGANERFEYTVIGEPVNEAARLCALAKDVPGHLLASSDAVNTATDAERAQWTLGETVTLRGHDEPTRLALPV